MSAIHHPGFRPRDVSGRSESRRCPHAVYYTIPLSGQKGYAHYPSAPTPVSERIGKTVVRPPMYPDLDAGTQDRIVKAVLASVGGA
jgi:dTDP-4-amino-4,6-dideoxygalactose transaminase